MKTIKKIFFDFDFENQINSLIEQYSKHKTLVAIYQRYLALVKMMIDDESINDSISSNQIIEKLNLKPSTHTRRMIKKWLSEDLITEDNGKYLIRAYDENFVKAKFGESKKTPPVLIFLKEVFANRKDIIQSDQTSAFKSVCKAISELAVSEGKVTPQNAARLLNAAIKDNLLVSSEADSNLFTLAERTKLIAKKQLGSVVVHNKVRPNLRDQYDFPLLGMGNNVLSKVVLSTEYAQNLMMVDLIEQVVKPNYSIENIKDSYHTVNIDNCTLKLSMNSRVTDGLYSIKHSRIVNALIALTIREHEPYINRKALPDSLLFGLHLDVRHYLEYIGSNWTEFRVDTLEKDLQIIANTTMEFGLYDQEGNKRTHSLPSVFTIRNTKELKRRTPKKSFCTNRDTVDTHVVAYYYLLWNESVFKSFFFPNEDNSNMIFIYPESSYRLSDFGWMLYEVCRKRGYGRQSTFNSLTLTESSDFFYRTYHVADDPEQIAKLIYKELIDNELNDAFRSASNYLTQKKQVKLFNGEYLNSKLYFETEWRGARLYKTAMKFEFECGGMKVKGKYKYGKNKDDRLSLEISFDKELDKKRTSDSFKKRKSLGYQGTSNSSIYNLSSIAKNTARLDSLYESPLKELPILIKGDVETNLEISSKYVMQKHEYDESEFHSNPNTADVNENDDYQLESSIIGNIEEAEYQEASNITSDIEEVDYQEASNITIDIEEAEYHEVSNFTRDNADDHQESNNETDCTDEINHKYFDISELINSDVLTKFPKHRPKTEVTIKKYNKTRLGKRVLRYLKLTYSCDNEKYEKLICTAHSQSEINAIINEVCSKADYYDNLLLSRLIKQMSGYFPVLIPTRSKIELDEKEIFKRLRIIYSLFDKKYECIVEFISNLERSRSVWVDWIELNDLIFSKQEINIEKIKHKYKDL
ncbi:hypothetical protein [Photobacterium leiognathi]|uniref:hypothetical protein n=1 Tax=Photobacterium leiognathi TaxID=553611 RepID=UPI00298173E3|nr:hypothetical protein [Photobacterium leiognathi]